MLQPADETTAVLDRPSMELLKAIGHLQGRRTAEVTAPMLPKVNAALGATVKPADLEDRYIGQALVWPYLQCLARPYIRRFNLQPNDEVYARLWAGGVNGYRDPDTIGFWYDVMAAMGMVVDWPDRKRGHARDRGAVLSAR